MRWCRRRCRASTPATGRRCAIRPASADSRRRAPPTAQLEVEAEVLPFIEDMAAAYAWADLARVPCRRHDHCRVAGRGLGRHCSCRCPSRPTIIKPRMPKRWCGSAPARVHAGARSDARHLGRVARGAHRGPRADAQDGAKPHAARASSTPRAARGRSIAPERCMTTAGGTPRRTRMNDRMRRIHRIHLVGIGGSGMGGIAEVLLNLGYEVQGSDLKSNAVTQRLARLGATIFIGHAAEHLGRCRRGGGLERRQPRESRDCGGAREAHPGRAARGNAGRADALPLLHRGRRHARQDHHHEPGRERARRRRPRSRPSSSAGA